MPWRPGLVNFEHDCTDVHTEEARYSHGDETLTHIGRDGDLVPGLAAICRPEKLSRARRKPSVLH
jgi:hypothetical protein